MRDYIVNVATLLPDRTTMVVFEDSVWPGSYCPSSGLWLLWLHTYKHDNWR